MYKTVAFVGWVAKEYTIDMCTTVPWPDLTPEAIVATVELGGGGLEDILKAHGCNDAVQLMGWIEGMRMRGNGLDMDEFWFNHEGEVSRAEIERACWNRMEGIDNESVYHGRIDDEFVIPFWRLTGQP